MHIYRIGLFAGMGLILSGGPVRAHHAFAAEFDSEKPVELRGTIARLELINPHSWIHLDVEKPDGTAERWMIEGGPPNTLFRRGFTQASLPVGTEIIVTGFQARDGSLKANGRDITYTDGSRPFIGTFGTGSP